MEEEDEIENDVNSIYINQNILHIADAYQQNNNKQPINN